MNQSLDRVRWHVRDLELLPQCKGTTDEVIDADLRITPSPHHKHQQIIGRILGELDGWSEQTGLGETILMPGVIFSEENAVIPALVWITKARLAAVEDAAGQLTAAPELIVEVLSPGEDTIRRDRQVKLKLYSVRGVQEYWSVDRFSQQVEIYRRQAAQRALATTLKAGDLLLFPLLPALSCGLDRLFP